MQLVNTYRLYVPFTQGLVWTTGTYRQEVPSCEHLAITNRLTVECILIEDAIYSIGSSKQCIVSQHRTMSDLPCTSFDNGCRMPLAVVKRWCPSRQVNVSKQ